MSDWIDDLKKRNKEQTDYERGIDEMRLHKAKVIRAKAPALWNAVIEQLEVDLKRLNETFPDDTSKHGELYRSENSFTLEDKGMPQRILKLTLNLDGQCIDAAKATKKDRFQKSLLKAAEPIPISVDHKEIVSFVWNKSYESSPSRIAEKMIKQVCDLGW